MSGLRGAAAAFEAALDPALRRARGVHFTPEREVAWVVGAVIVRPWRAALARARSLEALDALHARLAAWRVLDPACGAGAFLAAAWEALRAVERRLLARRAALGGGSLPARLRQGQLLGIELDPAALALARAALPGARLEAGDALLDGAGARRPWPAADAVVGNPPFLGAKRIAPERGAAWARALRAAMPEVPPMADLCVHFLRRAHEHLPPCTRADPLAGRAGLVLARNARSGASRAGGLDAVVRDGTIVEAWDNVPWPGAAQVGVSIACWVKTRDPALLPRRRRLWSGATGAPAAAAVPHLDASLRAAPPPGRRAAALAPLACNRAPKRCFQGVIPGYGGFLVGPRQAERLRADSAGVVRPYLTGRELLSAGAPRRFVLDFGALGEAEAARFPSALAHVRERVLPAVRDALDRAERTGSGMASARREHLGRFWQLWNRRDALRAALCGRDRYLACARVARRPLFLFVPAQVVPSDLVQVFTFDDLYSFGVLQSRHHAAWARARGSRLRVERDVRYAVREVFETFPWPQGPRFRGPPAGAVERVERGAAGLLAARE
ncbi:MAG TPA: DNA methyltransferase, partial [Anaeromyxobacteraceae bacterium]|nr:DNA methyltransferase [Anaeromyxobacteraceae bacterium]